MPSAVQHKVAKSDKVATIAKKYGHKDWKLIWKDPANKKLVKLRGKPEKIEPGDFITIPPNQAELAAAAAYATELQEAIITEMNHAKHCTEFASLFERLAKSNRKAHKSAKADWDKIIASTKYSIAYAEGTAKDVDVAADILALFTMTVGVAKSGAKAANAQAADMKAANDDFAATMVSAAANPLQKHVMTEGTKFLKDSKRNGSKGALLAGAVFDAFSDMQKPSFWGKKAAAVIGNGSLTGKDVDTAIKDLKGALKKNEKYRADTLSGYLTAADDLDKRAKELRSAAKRAASNIKTLEKQLKSLL